MKVATIGSGMIVEKFIENALKTKHIQPVAVYSRSMEKGRVFGEKFGISRVYDCLETLFKDEEIEGVYIASPNSLHFRQARAALLAGKHVICEKPFTTTLKEAKMLSDLARSRRLFLLEAITTTYSPNLEVIREYLPQIGRIRLVMSNFSQYSGRYDLFLNGELPNVFNPAYSGGALMDINVYNMYLVMALFGMPLSVSYFPNLTPVPKPAFAADDVSDVGSVPGDLSLVQTCPVIDTSGILVMNYQDFVCQCTGAKDTCGENFFQIEGEQGWIYVPGSPNALEQVRVGSRLSGQVRTINRQPDGHQWYYELLGLSELLGKNDLNECYRRLDLTLQVMEVLENARTKAGIVFPADREVIH